MKLLNDSVHFPQDGGPSSRSDPHRSEDPEIESTLPFRSGKGFEKDGYDRSTLGPQDYTLEILGKDYSYWSKILGAIIKDSVVNVILQRDRVRRISQQQ